ncbi:MAG: hypothetical protein Tsb008_01100 [Rhodothalassiaceae bacterium]
MFDDAGTALQSFTRTSEGFRPLAVLSDLPLGIFVCSLADEAVHPLLFINKHARRYLMIDESGEGLTLEDIPTLEFGEPLLGICKRALRLGRPLSHQWQIGIGADYRDYSCHIIPHNAGGCRQVICTLEDRTADKRAEANLLHHALHDGLTGLPNRSHFLNRLEEAVARCRADSSRHCAVMMINVDRFQLVNKTYGHPSGDRFLIELADALRLCLRIDDTLARFNGDEFAVLIEDMRDSSDALRLAERIHQMMAAPRRVGDIEAYMSVSIGIASTETSNGHPEDLIRDADISMHRAKTTGRGRTELFAGEQHGRRIDQLQLEADLRRAIEAGELELFYQPIVDLETGATIAFEALTRWQHPTRGYIPPSDFIPLAEDTGLIVPLGRWAIEEACRRFASWLALSPEVGRMYVNVNLSGMQFVQDDVPATVARALARSGIEGRHLRLEITESALVADPKGATEHLHRIKALGPTLALDDFGTGYSSLNYLNSFPIDCIKIDRSFVSRIDADEQSAKIVRIITMLADTLRMSVVAEGIENSEQHLRMRSLGCRFGQGYLFSRPLPAEDAEAHMKHALGIT